MSKKLMFPQMQGVLDELAEIFGKGYLEIDISDPTVSDYTVNGLSYRSQFIQVSVTHKNLFYFNLEEYTGPEQSDRRNVLVSTGWQRRVCDIEHADFPKVLVDHCIVNLKNYALDDIRHGMEEYKRTMNTSEYLLSKIEDRLEEV